MAGETTADAEVKLAGVDASSPTGTSVVMNIIAPSGGNTVKGTVQYEGAKFDWNSDNTQNSVAPGGTPTSQSINQWDASLGGPIMRDKMWVFGAYRYADLGIGVSRLPLDLAFDTSVSVDSAQFHPVQQLQHRQPALRQGDHAVELEADAHGALSVPARNQHQRSRARSGANLLQRRRRRRVFGTIAVGLVEPAHHERVGFIQQQGWEQFVGRGAVAGRSTADHDLAGGSVVARHPDYHRRAGYAGRVVGDPVARLDGRPSRAT